MTAGPSLPTLLTVVFVGLKLAGVLDWSWGWCVAPLVAACVVTGLVFVALLWVS